MTGAGQMDQRITLQRIVEVSDGAGGVTRAWADFHSVPCVWAHVRAKAGREVLNEGRVNATYVVVFTIYNRSDLTEMDRIVWNEQPYNIRGIRREGSRALRLTIEAERGVAS